MVKQKSLEEFRRKLSAKEEELQKAKMNLEQVEHKMNRLKNKIKTESKKQRDARPHALCYKAGHLCGIGSDAGAAFVGAWIG